jgi:predicted DNA-binding transcriptional regulator AlpA
LLPLSLPPRGLSREIAATYIGVSPTKFDELVQKGKMPPPKRIDRRKLWDKRAIDAAFDQLQDEFSGDDNPWSELK